MRNKSIPQQAIPIYTFADLEMYASRFAQGKFNLLAVVSTAGLTKTTTFERRLKELPDRFLPIGGHVTAFELYCDLFHHLDEPVLLDDADSLYQDRKTRPLLKCLCNTKEVKTLHWRSKAVEAEDIPRTFTTRSHVAIICNEWKTVGGNDIGAVTDRGIFLHFNPSVQEVHREVIRLGWADPEVVEVIGEHLHLMTVPSMRFYFKGGELKKAKIPNWQDVVLSMLNPNLNRQHLELVSRLFADETMTAKEKETAFSERTGMSRATYHRYKKLLEDRQRKQKRQDSAAPKEEAEKFDGLVWEGLREAIKQAVQVGRKRKTQRFISATMKAIRNH